jgi:hypothetical protein
MNADASSLMLIDEKTSELVCEVAKAFNVPQSQIRNPKLNKEHS